MSILFPFRASSPVSRLGLAILVAFASLLMSPDRSVASTDDFRLSPGNVYTVIQGGIRQYDPDLNFIADLLVPGMSVTEGLAFTSRGTLVFGGLFNPNGGGSTHHVLEINAVGEVVNDVNLRTFGLARASHIDIDRLGRIYVAAEPGIVEISADFSSNRVLDYNFTRSSGVTIGPDDRLYVTDQADDDLVVFDQNRDFDHSFRLGNTPTGIAFSPTGTLHAAIFSNRELRVVDLVGEQTTTVLTGIEGASDIAFAEDGSYFLSRDRGGLLEHRTADHLLIASIATGSFADSVAVMPVPEPAGLLLVMLAMLLLMRSRSRRCFK